MSHLVINSKPDERNFRNVYWRRTKIGQVGIHTKREFDALYYFVPAKDDSLFGYLEVESEDYSEFVSLLGEALELLDKDPS